VTTLGSGLAFPPRIGPDGRFSVSADAGNVRENIEVILRTGRGERLRLRGFGAGLEELRMAPNTPATHREAQERIRRALTRWEPRIALESVDVARDPEDAEAALATVAYRLVATQAPARLAVAFPVAG
jgi:uncharacterized protein